MRQRILREAAAGRGLLIATIVLAVGGGLAVVAQALLLADVVAQVFLGGAGLAAVARPLWELLAVVLVRAALGYLRQRAADAFSARVRGDLRRRLLERMLARGGTGAASGERTGDLVATALDGIENLDPYLANYLPQMALAALVPLTVLIAVLGQSLVPGLILLVTAGLLPYFMILLGRAAQRRTERQWRTLRLLGAHFLDVVRGLETLQLFGRSRRQVEIIRQVSDRHRLATLDTLKLAFLSAFALELLASLSTALVAVAISLALLGGALHFAQAFAILILVPEFYLPLRALGSDFHAGMSGAVAAERVFAVLDAPPPVVARGVRRLPEGAPLEIACRGIVHTYPGALQPALAGLDLLWRPGECIAVVGASGAGKTTLLRALLRLLDPQSGAILVDGVPLQELDLDWWRRQIAYVPQEPTLFPGSVLENIRLGRGDASPEEVEAAAREARAQAFIEQLPRGYATPVGEGGRPLSGGQRQRLAIARALVRRAPLLILDEPTVRLDAEADRDVSLALRDLARGRRALIVAHRLSTAELADRIVVLAGGRVVEEGPPERLRRTGDLYPRLRRSYFRLSEVP